ncbi:uncharacterized protein MONBRDRAFT_33815 [Monosiga brevicollis MX1]|uniref:CCR4-NOT transcription complex subunit 1 n=1 Tax=Monosiga brevicollis TaxID=81824 RepID=A9V7Q3_MONBE|nr:uncharacterized protein MONBRDRAFT_33815 [Monosiga brevicollis MX1]EDQ86346.1 predicted protein [Monosiga brevicollis MX1]|eukprot:XP_001748736.1 hypothetical protein [Monosiga brevicollis MX1]
MVAWYESAAESATAVNRLTRILEIAQDIKALEALLNARNFNFVMELAVLAFQREFLNLEKWLQPRLEEHPEAFATACLHFLDRRLTRGPEATSGTPSKALVIIAEQCGHLQSNRNISPQLKNALLNVAERFAQPRGNRMVALPFNVGSGPGATALRPPPLVSGAPLSDGVHGASSSAVDSFGPPVGLKSPGPVARSAPAHPDATRPTTDVADANEFTPAIEAQANHYFQQVYMEKTSVHEIIQLLGRFKASPDPEKQQVFHCMIRNLFDEYKFLPEYPDKQLQITGELFGLLVQHDLVYDHSLGNALRCIYEAVKHDPDSRLFAFGTHALANFHQRLPEWRDYCQALAHTPHFTRLPAEVRFACLNGRGGASAGPAGGKAGLMAESQPDPPENIRERVIFVINNLAPEPSRMKESAATLHGLLDRQYHMWFAGYLVEQRAMLEPNNLEMYVKLIDLIGQDDLRRATLARTYLAVHNAQRRQSSSSNISDSQERTRLKNLATFLGLQTLARNKPILQRDLDLKAIILSSYEQGSRSLQLLLPFVAKVLDTAQYSRVFRPPNPWLMSLLRILKELHSTEQLKISLKFEVEVLCRNLNIALHDIEASHLLPAKNLSPAFDAIGTPSFHGASPAIEGTAIGGGALAGGNAAGSAQTSSSGHLTVPASMFADLVPGQPRSIMNYIRPGPLSSLGLAPESLQDAIYKAIERAINEMLPPVFERSIRVASISCFNLITKDFNREPDETKMRQAGLLMIQNLAGSIAVVSAKDTLRTTAESILTTSIKNLLSGQSQDLEHIVRDVININLPVACSFIEATVRQRSVAVFEKQMAPQYLLRQTHRREGTTEPFEAAHLPYVDSMPENLRPQFGGLSSRQMGVYLRFARNQQDLLAVGRLTERPPVVAANQNSAPAIIDGLIRDMVLLTSGQAEPDAQHIGEHVNNILQHLSTNPAEAPRLVRFATTALIDHQKARSSALQDAMLNVLVRLKDALPGCVRDICLVAVTQCDGTLDTAEKLLRLVKFRLVRIEDLDTALVQALDSGRSPHGLAILKSVLTVALNGAAGSSFLLGLLRSITLFERIVTHQKSEQRHARLLESVKAELAKEVERGSEASNNASNAHAAGSGPGSTTAALPASVPGFGQAPAPTSSAPSGGVTGNLRSGGDAPTAGPALSRASNNDRLRRAMAMFSSLDLLSLDQDPPQLLELVASFFVDEWMSLYSSGSYEPAVPAFIRKLTENVLNSSDMTACFFRVATEVSVKLAFLMADGHFDFALQAPNYKPIDAFCALVIAVVRHFGDSTKVALLRKVLSVCIIVLGHVHDRLGVNFNQKPFHRLLSRLLAEVHTDDEHLAIQVLSSFANAFHVVRPAQCPAFALSWLDLISSRHFLPLMLSASGQSGQDLQHQYHVLVMDLLMFLQPLLRSAQLSDSVRVLYKATVTLVLVILHDFPDFLCQYYLSYCDVIAPCCLQLRNLILSAHPAAMRLPDPFSSPLSVDSVPEYARTPVISSNYTAALEDSSRPAIRTFFDYGLENQHEPTIHMIALSLKSMPHDVHFTALTSISGTDYNTPLLNALVTEIMVRACAEESLSDAAVGVLGRLLQMLDGQGRYLLAMAMANHLRFPNQHTLWMSKAYLKVYAAASAECQEQLTRVLFERLVVARPHPWGLLVTFTELIQNRSYDFWNASFIHIAPEIEKLFHTVARSCLHAVRPATQS